MAESQNIDRVAGASAQLFNAFDERLRSLDNAFRDFRGEMRQDLKSVETVAQNIEKVVSRIEGENILKRVEANESTIKELERRVRDQENFKFKVIGIAAAAGVFSSIVTGLIMLVIQRKL